MNKKIRKSLFFYGISFNSLILLSCVSKPVFQTFPKTFDCSVLESKSNEEYPQCSDSTEDDHLCQIRFEYLKPTKFSVGEEYIKSVYKSFSTQPKNFQANLCKFPINIVIGSKFNQGFYVTDGHQRLKVIDLFRNLNSTNFTIIAKVRKNYRIISPNLTKKDFWNSMVADDNVYLFDKGIPTPPEKLPQTIANLKNDPYLSLVSYIRNDKQKFCFDNELSSFQNYGESQWADYFRSYKGLEAYTDKKIYNYYKNRIIYFEEKSKDKKINICKSIEASHLPGYTNLNNSSPTLVIDSEGAVGEVKNFRTMKMLENIKNINKKGINNLNISGSAQFSESQLSWIKMNTTGNLIIVDLRQEAHGYINGNPVTWTAPMNWANIGKSKNNILIDESVRLNELLFQDYIAIPTTSNYKHNDFKLSDFVKLEIYSISREDEIAKRNDLGYYRITVSDYSKPTDENVDDFYSFYKTLKSDNWVHFHCGSGRGRTATFLAMFDMLKNANVVSFHDIIKRQAAMVPFYHLNQFRKHTKKKLQEDRYQFLKEFYLFSKDVQLGYEGTWKQWKASKP